MITNINTNSAITLGITAEAQSRNTDKLSSGYKVNRDNDTAATVSIKTKNASSVENADSAMGSAKAIDEVDAMIAQARANILANPQESVSAQANQQAAGVIGLI